MDEKHQHIDSLISDYLTGSINKNELVELNNWIAESKENQKYFDDYRQVWTASSIYGRETSFNANSAFNKFQSRVINKEVTENNKSGLLRRINISVMQAAASIILLVALGVGAVYLMERLLNPDVQVATNQTIVPLGSKSQVILPDGSIVTLNAGSKLTYDISTFNNDRQVDLVGEGYFKVKSSEKTPFIVKASGISVKATGTEFNVKAYPDENTVETILVEGKVEIGNKKVTDETLVLKPNERFVFDKSKNTSCVDTKDERLAGKELQLPKIQAKENIVLKYVETDSDLDALTSWKEKEWRIHREPLNELAVKLERKYDVKITFADEELKKFRFNGTLEDESLEQVLNAMSLTSPIKYKINGKEVVFFEDKAGKEKYKDLYIAN